jgi:hypothetical protein
VNIPAQIRKNIKLIRNYSKANPDLSQAHHFLYDKRYSNADNIIFIVMGINPGEPPKDTQIRETQLFEETSVFDFLKNERATRSAKRWKDKCGRVCGTLDIALTEAFFWSSHTVAQLHQRWGRNSLKDSPPVKFCARLNKQLISIHSPKAVIFTGISHVTEIAQLYQLTESRAILSNAKGHRLSMLYHDRDGLPWIFVKHFSARISNLELDQIADFVKEKTLIVS